MGFSITSAVMGGIIIIAYSLVLTWLGNGARIAVSVILLILGIVEFVMGIWAAVCLCVMKPCCGPAQVSVPLFRSRFFPIVVIIIIIIKIIITLFQCQSSS